MIRLFYVDLVVSGSNPLLLNFYLEIRESSGLGNARHMNHQIWSHRVEGWALLDKQEASQCPNFCF